MPLLTRETGQNAIGTDYQAARLKQAVCVGRTVIPRGTVVCVASSLCVRDLYFVQVEGIGQPAVIRNFYSVFEIMPHV